MQLARGMEEKALESLLAALACQDRDAVSETQVRCLLETYKQSLKTYLRFLKEKKNIEDELVSFEAFTRDYVKSLLSG